MVFSCKYIRPVRTCLFGLNKSVRSCWSQTLTLKVFYLNSSNSLPFFLSFFLFFFLSVHTLKTECNVSLSVAPTRLKELLNMVYHKGQSWDLYSSAPTLIIYLCIYTIKFCRISYARGWHNTLYDRKMRRANLNNATAALIKCLFVLIISVCCSVDWVFDRSKWT